MKKHYALLLLISVTLLACDDKVDPLPIDEVLDGIVLSKVRHETGDQSWEQLYQYDDDGKLIFIEEINHHGNTQQFLYSDNQLVEIRHLDQSNDQLIFRDSLALNAQGLVERVYNFSINQGTDVPLNSITYLSYDGNGQLTERQTVYERLTDYTPRDVHYWENGNVIQTNRFNGDEKMQEFYYTYDDKLALPHTAWQNTGFQYVKTRNNVVSTDWTDYTGLLDTACKPCTGTYTYNDHGLPASYTTNWGYTQYFEYKELPKSEE